MIVLRKIGTVCRAAGAALCMLIVSACQTPMQSGSQCTVEPGYLDSVSQFSWVSANAIDVDDKTGYVSPIVERELVKAVANELNNKGFSYADQSDTANAQGSEIKVSVVLRTRRELVSMETNPSPCLETDCWERIEPGAGTRMDIRTIGFLAADVFFAGEPIWRGWVETNLYPHDRDHAAEVIAKAIPKLFESFPP